MNRIQRNDEATWEDFVEYCTPGSPEYDVEFHEAIYKRQPHWFQEEGAPPLPPSVRN